MLLNQVKTKSRPGLILHLFLTICIGLYSCNNNLKTDSTILNKSEISGLASPVQLNHDRTIIYTADYFSTCSLIDSVSGHPAFSLILAENKAEIEIEVISEQSPWLSELKVWILGLDYSILLKKSQKIKTSIRLNDPQVEYSTVQLAGEMNNWNPKEGKLDKKEGYWETELWLNPGIYQYQLVVDNNWILDPDNPEQADNSIGGVNSLLTVAQDIEAVPQIACTTFSDKNLGFSCRNNPLEVFVFWQNARITSETSGGEKGTYTCAIPESARKMKRTFIRIWAYNHSGISNDVLIPLEYGKVVDNVACIDRNDLEASVMYFVLVDRFNNGNKLNDHPVKDTEVAPQANYYGGDLSGIYKKIEDGYFANLGINTLWLSPIVQNPLYAYTEFPAPHRKFSGYHGYWPVSSTKIDHRFGTNKDLSELVDLAHTDSMNVLMDFVANHVHEQHPMYIAHPEWATDLYLPDSSLNIRIWDEQRLTTWFDTFLPSLDFSKPEVVQAQTDSAIYWLNKFNLDGFRHDATKHIPEIFWRTLTRKIKDMPKAENKRLYQIGETFGSRELINSYVSSGQLDAQFDFNLYFDARTAFAKDSASFEDLNNSLKSSFFYYGYHNLMGNISGNHDIPRFISYAGEAISFEEDPKEAGWTRDVQIKNPIGYSKLRSLLAFIMTIPGVPIIYYGDEIGMVGAGDPDNRRPMKFAELNDEEAETKKICSSLIKLRNSSLSLIYGDFETLVCTNDLYVYQRSYFDEHTVVLFNKSAVEKEICFSPGDNIKSINLKTLRNSQVQTTDSQYKVKVAAFSFEILTSYH